MSDVIVNVKTGNGEGYGAIEPMPRVTVRMTRPQLERVIAALNTADLYSLAEDYRKQVDAEMSAIGEALESLGTEPDPEAVYDISLAPEVSAKFS